MTDINWNKTKLKLYLAMDIWDIRIATIVLASIDPKMLRIDFNYANDKFEVDELFAKQQFAKNELEAALQESQTFYNDIRFIWQSSQYDNDYYAEFGFLEEPKWFIDYFGKKGFHPKWKEWAQTNIPSFITSSYSEKQANEWIEEIEETGQEKKYSKGLSIAIEASNSVSKDENTNSKNFKKQLLKYLNDNFQSEDEDKQKYLSKEAKENIAKVANKYPKGGAPKTPES